MRRRAGGLLLLGLLAPLRAEEPQWFRLADGTRLRATVDRREGDTLHLRGAWGELAVPVAEVLEPAPGPDPAVLRRQAAERAGARLLGWLRGRGCQADYQTVVDEPRAIVWLHTRAPAQLAPTRAQVEEVARLLGRDLFLRRGERPLVIVLLTREDGPAVLERGAGGLYDPRTGALLIGDVPPSVRNRTSIVVHELTHALHFADQGERGQRHPTWLVEGLGALFESSAVVEDRLVPRPSARLGVAQRALRAGEAIPWRRLLEMTQGTFLQSPYLAYAESRYLLFWLEEQGLLQRLYQELTRPDAFQADRTGQEALEVVCGRPLEEAERAWKAWLLRQEPPPIPFIGVGMQPGAEGCQVVDVVAGSAAEVAGLRVGDLLTGAEGVRLRAPDDLLEVLSTRDPGETIELELTRAGEALRVRVTLGKK